MSYLYKLVDQKEIEMAKKGIISLSHPIFEFKGSEGRIINFAKRIYDKYNQQGLNVLPSKDDLRKIKDWIEAYKQTYGTNFRDIDIISESMIMFCGIMQGFCGYFTTKELDNKAHLREYLSNCKLKDKIGVIRIDDDCFKTHHWRTDDLEKPFIIFTGKSYDLNGYNGFLHQKKIRYIQNDTNLELLRIFNSGELRYPSNWFNNLSQEFEWQCETRLVFLLRSLEKNSSRIGCNQVYKPSDQVDSYEKAVYCNIVDAIHYYSNKSPRYIELGIGKENINIFLIEDIMK